jgi:hypothetical protein
VTHIDERPSEAPLGKPAFRDRCPWGDFVAPDLSRVAEEARWLAEPASAAITCLPWRGGTGQGWLVTPSRMEDDDGELIQRWLAGVECSGPLLVPGPLRSRMGCSRALAVPMQGPTRRVGALALPLCAGWGPMARELEGLGSDFARRLEAADQRAQRLFLRIASVGNRPAGRRDWEHPAPNHPPRVLALRAPRPRAGYPAPRHADAAAAALGREAPALGRR